jgi:hypothetical protein
VPIDVIKPALPAQTHAPIAIHFALSTTDIFLAPTPEIRALHDKSILIVTPSGDQMWAKICVDDADPEGRDAGKCSVIVWTTSTDERGLG